MAMLADLDRQVKEAMNKKQESLRELRELQSQLKSSRNAPAHPQPASPLSYASPMHSAAPSVTFEKHDNTDYQLLEFKIESAKRELKNMDDQISSRRKMYENSLGVNTAEVLAIIEERDALKKKLASGDFAFSYVEKLELERQVNIAKEQVFAEQKNARKQGEKLQDEIEDCQKTIEDYQMANQELVGKIEQLEGDMRKRGEEGREREDQLKSEIRDLRNEIEDRKVAEHRLSLDAADKEKSNQDLQMIVIEKEKQITQAHDEKSQMARDQIETISNLKAEHASHVKSLTEKLESEQKIALANLDKKKTEEMTHAVDKLKAEISEFKSNHCRIVDNYNYDLESLKKNLAEEQQKSSDLIRKMKTEFEDDIKSTIHKERMFNDEEQSRLVSKEKQIFEDELKRVSSRLNDAIEYEKSQLAEMKTTNEKLKRELENSLEKHKADLHEMTAAHEGAIGKLRNQHFQEIEQLRNRMTSERDTEVEKLCKQSDELEGRLRHLDKDHVDLTTKVDHFFNVFDHHEKTIVCEVNDLCKVIAEALDIDPRKVTSKMSQVKPHQMLLNPALQKTTTRNCLANMRATVTDLVNNYSDLQNVINGLRHQLKDLRKETEQKLVTLTEHMSVANEKEREGLKEELENAHAKIVSELQNVIRSREAESDDLKKKLRIMENEVEDLHKSMTKWKEETAARLSQTFETEMKSLYLRKMREEQEATELLNKQKLLIKLEDQISRLRAEQALGKSSDPSTAKLISHLQERIRGLKFETHQS
ncbi:repetitive organellar protein-like isoform X2 [Symsagittifera roscoffensis]